jgi:hypothetical protein
VQFLEVSDWGIRSAFYRLRSPTSALEVRLFPMQHLGEAAFYAEVQRRLEACDFVLAEGVGGGIAALLTSYRLVQHTQRLGLVHQTGALDLKALPGTVIRPDLTGAEFDRRWLTAKGWERLVMPLLAPLYWAHLALFGSRRSLAGESVDDLLPAWQALMADHPLLTLLLGKRDERLLRVIEDLHAAHTDAPASVGVLYGAEHLRAVTDLLLGRLSYRVTQAEWVTIMTFD